ncbi:hypothetical protein G6R40_01160 [Chryseobacterium sp. POL2]|uniref:hypothetical protein n=1 Tax=Chryseobacterium sp. POL2 TaxID=2713414 RepID=UPI0013E14095|nr:hypothetical protein [Chryseobacterium sp. POL2]QIG88347.1 hypothetical protein G6R40_01160 [Chryseobacterium sp. POL2]
MRSTTLQNSYIKEKGLPGYEPEMEIDILVNIAKNVNSSFYDVTQDNNAGLDIDNILKRVEKIADNLSYLLDSIYDKNIMFHKVNEEKHDLKGKFETEKYLKNSMYSLLGKNNLLNEYHDTHRYAYAWDNPLAFSKTNMYYEYRNKLNQSDRLKFDDLLRREREIEEDHLQKVQ